MTETPAVAREKRGLLGKILCSLIFLPFLASGVWVTWVMIDGFFHMAAVYRWDETDCLIVASTAEKNLDAADLGAAYCFKVSYTYRASFGIRAAK